MIKIKEIKDFPNYYISTEGKVFSKNGRWNKSLKELKQYTNKLNGYCYVCLVKDNKKFNKRVHKLVAETFLTNNKKQFEINHKNGIKTDNNVENLEWVTHSENIKHRFRILNQPSSKAWLGKFGKESANSKIILQIKNGKIIAEFYGTCEANRHTNINPSNITSCCRGKRSKAGGFQWKYKD